LLPTALLCCMCICCNGHMFIRLLSSIGWFSSHRVTVCILYGISLKRNAPCHMWILQTSHLQHPVNWVYDEDVKEVKTFCCKSQHGMDEVCYNMSWYLHTLNEHCTRT
jgi:hypothetical protein